MPSRTTHAGWVVESGRMMLALPYAHISDNAIIRQMFVGPGARRRAERWAESRTPDSGSDLRR